MGNSGDIPTAAKGEMTKRPDALRSEQKPHGPRYKLEFLFAAHRTASDKAGNREAMEKADIYLPELAGWGKEEIEDYNAIAQGKKTPDQLLTEEKIAKESPEYNERKAWLDSFHGTGIKVGCIDLPADHPLVISFNAEMSRRGLLTGIYFGSPPGESPSFERLIEEERKIEEKIARIQSEREDYILARLKPEVKRLVQENPQMRDKDEINIVITIGSQHTRLYHKTKNTEWNAGRKFKHNPTIFGFEGEATRRPTLHKPVDNLLVARTLLEATALTYIDLGEYSSKDYYESVVNFISVFSYDEIKGIFEKLRRGGNNRKSKTEKSLVLKAAFFSKGLFKKYPESCFTKALSKIPDMTAS